MRAYLLSPSPQTRRVDCASFLRGTIIAGTPAARVRHVVDLDDFKRRLKGIRAHALTHLDRSVAQLIAAMGQQLPAVDVFYAVDAKAAVEKITAIAGETKPISINKSGLVGNELASLLRERGFPVAESYYDQFPETSGRFSSGWELPELDNEWIAASFSQFQRATGTPRNLRRVIALLGVSAISADNGSIFFVQHFYNIQTLLAEAEDIVFVAGLEKILPSKEEAEFQARCTAVFGAKAALMGLKPKNDGRGRTDDVAEWDKSPAQHQRVHLIIMDNGRRTILSGLYRELLTCIGCRACVEECPTQRYFGGWTRMNPREYLMYSLTDASATPDLCSLCNQCHHRCPLGIDIPWMVSRLRGERAERGWPSLQRLMLANPQALGKVGTGAAPLVNRALQNGVIRGLMEKTAKIDHRRHVPRYVRGSRFPDVKRKDIGGRKVAYFVGCWARYSEPSVADAMLAVLQRCGIEAICPDEHCCGVPQLANGFVKEARRNADQNVRTLSLLINSGFDIVSTCPSCTLALKQKYSQLSTLDAAREVAEHTYHFSEYLLMLRDRGELDLGFEETNKSIGFHTPCHLKTQDLEGTVVELLSLIPGARVQYLNRGCCGISGTFGFKCGGYLKSMEIGKPLFDALGNPELAQISTDCGTCKLQMEQGGGRSVTHPIAILQEAMAHRAG
ncbi:MAG: anaerobic glycerol-3-phosphate dehydrogenase subunit C [Chloroflexota bacterium]|nr:MAG: anaerobic glycerol-3-phosphate dehydrogenase subunit C [Chloroflexota bacterium]